MAEDHEMKTQAEKTPIGTVLPACPRCGGFEPHQTNRDDWYCPPCGHSFTAPAYYQRVEAPVLEPETPPVRE